MTSPCKGCQRRTLGCHNMDTCQEWHEYVEVRKKATALKAEAVNESKDIRLHLQRHGYKAPRK